MRTVLITGASSGIGAALARHYAQAGVTLILIARRADRLDAVAESCRALGAQALVEPMDVRDRDAVGARLRDLDAHHPLDLIVINAGVNGGDPQGGLESEATAFETIDINLGGAVNVALPCVSLMSARGHGQIALVSSLAAFAPLPDAPAYSGSKAALLAHGLALRAKLRPSGVRVSVVAPGYVRTEMGSDYSGWRPLEISAEAAAARIARGLERDRAVIAFPGPLAFLARHALLVPDWIRDLAMTSFRFRTGKSVR